MSYMAYLVEVRRHCGTVPDSCEVCGTERVVAAGVQV